MSDDQLDALIYRLGKTRVADTETMSEEGWMTILKMIQVAMVPEQCSVRKIPTAAGNKFAYVRLGSTRYALSIGSFNLGLRVMEPNKPPMTYALTTKAFRPPNKNNEQARIWTEAHKIYSTIKSTHQ